MVIKIKEKKQPKIIKESVSQEFREIPAAREPDGDFVEEEQETAEDFRAFTPSIIRSSSQISESDQTIEQRIADVPAASSAAPAADASEEIKYESTKYETRDYETMRERPRINPQETGVMIRDTGFIETRQRQIQPVTSLRDERGAEETIMQPELSEQEKNLHIKQSYKRRKF